MCLIKVRIVKGDSDKVLENVAVIELKSGVLVLKDIFLREVARIGTDVIEEFRINTVDAVAVLKLR